MAAASPSAPTLLEYMGRAGTPADLAVLVAHIQGACKSIAALAASPGNADLSRAKAAGSGAEAVAAGRDAPKPLDELSVRAYHVPRGFLLFPASVPASTK
jgi:fructose-1,6-bisphosphatase I